MAKPKFKNNEKNRGLKSNGILLDPAKISSSVRTKDVEVNKDELYEELARDWMAAESLGKRLSIKRQVRVLEKALTAPAFADSLIPLRSNDSDEALYFMALARVKDTVLYIQDLMYDEMFLSEEARRDSTEPVEEVKKADDAT